MSHGATQLTRREYVRDGARGELLPRGEAVHTHVPGAEFGAVVHRTGRDVLLLDIGGEPREFRRRDVHAGARCQ